MFGPTMQKGNRNGGVSSMTSPIAAARQNPPQNGGYPTTMQRQQHPQSTLPTRAQVVAMGLCYRRLAFVWAMPPLVCVLGPWSLQVALMGCNLVSKGYGAPLLLATFVLTQAWYRLVEQMAPDQEKLHMAYEKSAGVLPLIMFMISALVIRSVIAPFLEEFPVVAESIQWICSIRVGTGIIWPAGTALLGIAVLAKFVGPFSIVRCSTVPTVSNPYARPIYDPACLLSFIASPSDHPGEMVWAPEFRNQQQIGRRYQFPTLQSFLGILFFYLLIAGFLSEYIVINLWNNGPHHTTHMERKLICLTCYVTMIFHLFHADSLMRSMHEIDPKKYLPFAPTPGDSPRPSLPLSRPVSMIKFVIATALLAPLLSTGVLLFMDIDISEGKSGRLLGFFCFATSAVFISFLTLLDNAMRLSLCTPGCRLESIIREMKRGIRGIQKDSSVVVEEEEDELMDVLVRSLAHGDHNISSQILKTNASLCDIQHSDAGIVEVRRNEKATDDMSKVLLLGNPSHVSEAPLEEDMLRFIILESVGGSLSDDRENDPLFLADERHEENIRRWIERRQPKVVLRSENAQRVSAEQIGIVLVRSLCVYSGGLGKALTDIANKPMPNNITWTLPPGAVLAAEYAMIGVARCIAAHFSLSPIAADWRSTHLAMLIPTALNTAYTLRTGINDYFSILSRRAIRQSKLAATPEMAFQHIKEHPELMRVVEACEYLPTVVLKQFLAPERNNLKSIVSAMSEHSFKWCQELVKRSSPIDEHKRMLLTR